MTPIEARREADRHGPITVRFWYFIGPENGDYVRLSLRDGETLSFTKGGPTDEGYHFETITFEREGDTIRMTEHVDARDCDGPSGGCDECYTTIDRLAAFVPDMPKGLPSPTWDYKGGSRYDTYAERMGY